MSDLNLMTSTALAGMAVPAAATTRKTKPPTKKAAPSTDSRGTGKQPPAAPEYGRIEAACKLFGFSRSGVYRLAAEGKLRLIKLENRSVLVDFASARKLLGEAPTV